MDYSKLKGWEGQGNDNIVQYVFIGANTKIVEKWNLFCLKRCVTVRDYKTPYLDPPLILEL